MDPEDDKEWENSSEIPPYRPWETEGWKEEDDSCLEDLAEALADLPR